MAVVKCINVSFVELFKNNPYYLTPKTCILHKYFTMCLNRFCKQYYMSARLNVWNRQLRFYKRMLYLCSELCDEGNLSSQTAWASSSWRSGSPRADPSRSQQLSASLDMIKRRKNVNYQEGGGVGPPPSKKVDLFQQNKKNTHYALKTL